MEESEDADGGRLANDNYGSSRQNVVTMEGSPGLFFTATEVAIYD